MIAKLIVASGKSAGRAITLKHGKLLIGRAEDCDVRPLGEEVSRRHCSVVAEGDVLTVEDLKSRNGTYVNGAKIAAKTSVTDGDLIRVGPLELKVSCSAPVAPVAMDDVSRWLMADDEPAGMFDTTQTVKTADSVGPVSVEPADRVGASQGDGGRVDGASAGAGGPAASAGGSAEGAAKGPSGDSSVSASTSVSGIEALLAAKLQPGGLPPEARAPKVGNSKDAAAEALKKFFGKR